MIVDASIVVPWFVADLFTGPAEEFRRFRLIAPNLIMLETTNVILRQVRAGRFPVTEVMSVQQSLRRSLAEVVDDYSLLPSATEIAADSKHKLYDCLYIALALARREPLVTADKRMAAIARGLAIEIHLIEAAR